MTALSKEALRRDFRERRGRLGPEGRARGSVGIKRRLLELAAYQRARAIAAYWPLADEVDVRDVIADALKRGKNVFLPRVNKGEARLDFCAFDGAAAALSPGPFGIMEPVSAASGAFAPIILPGLAFDLNRHRLGYGAGYYDRFLKSFGATKIGVAFDVPTIDILPIDEHAVAV